MRWYRIIAEYEVARQLHRLFRDAGHCYMYLGNSRFFVKVTDNVLLYIQIRFPTDMIITEIVDPGVQDAVEQTYLGMYRVQDD